ncbi:hypothetical protein DPMN_020103 [Dreissena polymorpha]|uniref:Cadherin domain-containing protein n=1 Tax=Dreissena polymorpha TaxID=45954 RepID=A0A9D4S7X0_DREPO|nr:hypothetical protein DPMN_020103 [Dreissena polymorpha]
MQYDVIMNTLLPSTGSSINDGLQAAAATIHTFNVTDSDDRRNPPFEVVAATSHAVSPYVMNVDCTDAVTAVSSTFTQPVLDKPPTFVSGIPGNSPDVSDTTSDPDTTCSVTLPVTTVYEIRKVASPTDPQKPEFEVWISNAVTQASIDFKDPPVSLTLTIKCTDRNVLNDITGTFNVNIVDSPPVFTALPATGTNIFDGLKHATETLHTFSVTDSDDAVNCSARFTTTDPDTACSVTSPSTTVYEIRNVTSPVNVSQPEFEVKISSTVTEAAIDFNDQAVPLTLTIRCTDGNPVNVITGTFNVNIVDEDPVLTSFPMTSYQFLEDTSVSALELNSFSLKDSDDVISA